MENIEINITDISNSLCNVSINLNDPNYQTFTTKENDRLLRLHLDILGFLRETLE